MDSKAELQAIETNPAISARRVSDKHGISQSSPVVHLDEITAKNIQAVELCLTLPKYCKTFDSP